MSSRSSRSGSTDSQDIRSTCSRLRKSRSPSPKRYHSISSDTSDPKLKKCRVYVSNVGSEHSSILDIKARFEKHGEILGISIHRGFAFVQFSKESSAERAIKEEDRTMFNGRKIEVKTAAVSSELFGRSRDSTRSISPGSRHSRERSRDRDRRDRRLSRDRSPIGRDRDYYDSRFRDGFRDERYGDLYPTDDPIRSSRYDDKAFHRGVDPYSLDKVDPNRTNDCEIVVCNKVLRSYGESVERRLKNLGLSVDLLFLKDEAALLPTIDDIARRGSLYAIVIADQHEAHRSLTLNILHGTPQEHRNMPLDDAMKLVALNYHEYVQSLRDKKMKGVTPVAKETGDLLTVPLSGVGKSNKIMNLLKLLADGKYLTAAELEVVIIHLQEQRNEILMRERGDHLQDKTGVGSPKISFSDSRALNFGGLQNANTGSHHSGSIAIPGFGSSEATTTQSSGWHGLGNVGNFPAGISSEEKKPLQPVTSKAGNSFLNFDNPTVQRALDSLIQSGPNLLKSVFGNTSGGQKLSGNDGGYPNHPSLSHVGGSNMTQNSPLSQGSNDQKISSNLIPLAPHNHPLHEQMRSKDSQQIPHSQGNEDFGKNSIYQQGSAGLQTNNGNFQQQFHHEEGNSRSGAGSYIDQNRFSSPQDQNRLKPEQQNQRRHPLLGTPVSGHPQRPIGRGNPQILGNYF